MESLEQRLDRVLEAIDRAACLSGRTAQDITLVAVSKLHSIEKMNQAAAALRDRGRGVVFGENYLQEYVQKRSGIAGEYETHLIGPLQSNKVTKAVREFDVIQSVHHEKVLRLIDRAAREAGKQIRIFLQVNISRDPAKAGFAAEQLEQVLGSALAECPHVVVEGLMTITELYDEPESARGDFVRMRELRDSLAVRMRGAGRMLEPLALSMGMSADFEIAIAEGATHVRIGTAIFGER